MAGYIGSGCGVRQHYRGRGRGRIECGHDLGHLVSQAKDEGEDSESERGGGPIRTSIRGVIPQSGMR